MGFDWNLSVLIVLVSSGTLLGARVINQELLSHIGAATVIALIQCSLLGVTLAAWIFESPGNSWVFPGAAVVAALVFGSPLFFAEKASSRWMDFLSSGLVVFGLSFQMLILVNVSHPMTFVEKLFIGNIVELSIRDLVVFAVASIASAAWLLWARTGMKSVRVYATSVIIISLYVQSIGLLLFVLMLFFYLFATYLDDSPNVKRHVFGLGTAGTCIGLLILAFVELPAGIGVAVGLTIVSLIPAYRMIKKSRVIAPQDLQP